MHDSLRRNSSLLIFSQAISAGSAFVFWAICARLYSTSDVGHATAIISFGTLIAAFTTLGLPNTIVRFLPTSKHEAGLFVASLIAVFSASIIGAFIALSIISYVSPSLSFLKSSMLLSTLLIALIVGNAISALLDNTLLSFKKGEYILVKSIITNIPRLLIPFFVVALGAGGIVLAFVVLIIIGIVYTVILIFKNLLRGHNLKPRLNEVTEHKSFAISNYAGGLLGILPATLLPIIVINQLGASQAAYFYMPMQLAGFLTIICGSTSAAFFTEASQDGSETKLKKHISNAVRHLYTLLIPAAFFMIIAGWFILHAYGSAYVSNGYPLLVVLCLASFIVGVNILGDSWLNVRKKSLAYFAMNALDAVLIITFAYFAAPHGILAIGISWLCAQLVSAIVYILCFVRVGLLTKFKG